LRSSPYGAIGARHDARLTDVVADAQGLEADLGVERKQMQPELTDRRGTAGAVGENDRCEDPQGNFARTPRTD
jgi:hypothetical protein